MLTNKTDDITRASVQKSVCVLSRLPLYGHIQVKMSLITEAYFREVRKSLYLLDIPFHYGECIGMDESSENCGVF